MRVPLHLLILQLLPILVFLVVDALVADPAWAIASALGFVAFQTVLLLVRGKKLDGFILVDALLIGGMGAASLLTDNQRFFQLKPAVIEAVMVPYLVFLALAPARTLEAYFDRYLTGFRIQPAARATIQRLLLVLAGMVLLHAGLVVLASFCWSRQVWGWVAGPGFYLLLVPLLAWSLVKRRQMRRSRPRDRPGARLRR